MKKINLFIGLAALLVLASCSGTSNDGGSDSSSSADTSSSEGTSSGTSTEETGWSEDDLADMAAAFSPLSCTLPFPNGLSSSYSNGSQYYSSYFGRKVFYVSDASCGNINDSYFVQLEANGLVCISSGTDTTYSVEYYFFQYLVKDSLEAITVQISYYDENGGYGPLWDLVAYYGEEDGMYVDSGFPYARIESELGATNASSAIPSFDTTDDGYWSYYYYDSYYSVTYLAVQGFYDSTADEAALYTAYKSSLTEFGYTVTDYTGYQNYGSAVNDDSGYALIVDVADGSFTIYILYVAPDDGGSTGGDTSANEGTSTLSLVNTDFPHEYADSATTFTSEEGITFGYYNVKNQGSSILFSSTASRDGGQLWNTTSLGKIVSIVLTIDPEHVSYYTALTMYVSSSVITDTTGLTSVTPSLNDGTYIYNVDGDYSYFMLVNEGETYSSRNTLLTINYSL